MWKTIWFSENQKVNFKLDIITRTYIIKFVEFLRYSLVKIMFIKILNCYTDMVIYY